MNQPDLFDHPVISERYFFPRPGQPSSYRDFQTPDGVRLRCLESRPHPGAKTLVHDHGNGEIVADYVNDYVDAIVGLGVNLLMVEYRGYGGSTGQPQLGRMLADVAAVRTACGLSPEETVLYGRSVGAIFAVEWAFQEPKIAGLILESGVADPMQRLEIRLDPQELGVDRAHFEAACAQRLDHREKLSGYFGPLLVLHAAHDTLVTAEHAQRHMKWAPGPDKRLVLFPRGDHNDVMAANWADYLQQLSDFLK